MTIAIVATLAKPLLQAAPDSRATDALAAAAESNSPQRFADLLLGQAAVTNKALIDEELPVSDGSAPVDSDTAAADAQQLLASLALPLAPPARAPALDSPAAADPIAPTPAGRHLQLASTPAGAAVAAPQRPDGDAPELASKLPALADQPAKLAVADSTPVPPQQVAPDKPEPGAAVDSRDMRGAPQPIVAQAAAPTEELPRDLKTALRDPAWASELGQELLWFVGKERQIAQLTVHPPQLGSIEITLNMDQDNTSAYFVSANPDVRGAIEAAVPRLREMFASAGIELAQVSIGSESLAQQPDGQRDPSHPPRRPADNAILAGGLVGGLPSTPFVTQSGHGLIDIFA